MKKIITHNGIFHADEVLAVALLCKLMGNPPVERTRTISEEDYNDPEIWIVDVGGRYDWTKSNFDHHQNSSLDSACVLVLEHLLQTNVVSIDLYNELIDDFRAVSEIDCNGPKADKGFTFNALIKSFNALGFDTAFDVACNYIVSKVIAAGKIAESQEIWDRGEKVSKYTRVCDQYPVYWKRYQKESFLIYPEKGKWNLVSINSDEFPIEATGKEEFIHNNKFIAVYVTKKDAVIAAKKSEHNAINLFLMSP